MNHGPLEPNEQIDVTKLVKAIELILPLSKGYASYHPEVKSNYRYIDIAQELLRKYYDSLHNSPAAVIPDMPAERDWSEVVERLTGIAAVTYSAPSSFNDNIFRAKALRILQEADKPVEPSSNIEPKVLKLINKLMCDIVEIKIDVAYLKAKQ